MNVISLYSNRLGFRFEESCKKAKWPKSAEFEVITPPSPNVLPSENVYKVYDEECRKFDREFTCYEDVMCTLHDSSQLMESKTNETAHQRS